MQPMKSTAASTDKTIAQLQSRIVDLETKVRFYEEQFNLLQHKRFGRSSEKPDTQAELFNEAESIIAEEERAHQDDTEADSAQITITYTRKKPGRKLHPGQTVLPAIPGCPHILPDPFQVPPGFRSDVYSLGSRRSPRAGNTHRPAFQGHDLKQGIHSPTRINHSALIYKEILANYGC